MARQTGGDRPACVNSHVNALATYTRLGISLINTYLITGCLGTRHLSVFALNSCVSGDLHMLVTPHALNARLNFRLWFTSIQEQRLVILNHMLWQL